MSAGRHDSAICAFLDHPHLTPEEIGRLKHHAEQLEAFAVRMRKGSKLRRRAMRLVLKARTRARRGF